MTGVVDAVDVSVEVFGGLVTNLAPADLPHGVSPDCQDLQFTIGSVKTRPGITALYTLTGSALVQYMKTYENLQEVPRFLSLDSLGVLRTDSSPGGSLSTIYNGIIPGSFCRSDSLFGNEYLAFGNGTNGLDIPRQYNDTNLDRISQVGPGAPPAVVDSATVGNISAGLHGLSVIFVTRTGYYTRPAPPVYWTAAGSFKADISNIPIGPPNVVARILCFTAVAQASFYHLGPQGITLPTSNMYIADNTTTAVTVDFTDEILLLGTLDDPLFTQIELPPVAGIIGYSTRLFAWGEQGNLQNFINLTFDGGTGGAFGAASVTKSPTVADGGDPAIDSFWNNANNIFAPDAVVATTTVWFGGLGNQSQLIKASGYGFAIPPNATITGIVVAVLCDVSTVNCTDDFVYLMNAAGMAVGLNHANGNQLTLGLTDQTYGSSMDLWGATWTPADINDPNFGAAWSCQNTNLGGPGVNVSIDYISIQVYYTTPAGTNAPLGWTQAPFFAGGNSALSTPYPVVWGDAYSITGDGATAVRGQITQSAATDYLGSPVLLPNTAYGVRARVMTTGGLTQGVIHVNLQSTTGLFTTGGLAVAAGQATGAYQLFTGILTAALGAIPADLLLQVYVDGTPTNGGVFVIDNIEIYPLNAQFNNSNVRASFGQLNTQGQESFDSETGLIEYNLNDGQSARNLFKIRERLYIVKEHSFGVTQDDGVNEPSLWTVDDVSKAVGTPSVNGVGVGEDWVVMVHRTGLYLYWGGEVLKISEEIQPTWDSINWQYGWTISCTVDTRKRRILICAPFGASTIPNKTLVLDYHDVGSDAEAIAANPPIHLTYTGNKKAFDRSRKWCPWTISANSIAQIELANGETGMYFGSNDGTGNVNVLDDTGAIFTDNGGVIPSYYTMAFFVEQIQEQPLQLGSHRKLFSYLTMYIQGSGQVGMTAYLASLSNAVVLNPQALVNPAVKDTEMMLDQLIERMTIKLSSSGTGQWFDLQRMTLSVKKDPWAPVRGSN